MQLSVRYSLLAKTMSVRAAQVMDHFGIGFEQGEHVVVDGLEVPLQSGHLVLFHGESGSGKSSLMRRCVEQLRDGGAHIINLDELQWEERILIDLLPLPASDAMRLLSACGLGEAQLLLRTPAELSDGQRYRFRLALALAQQPDWIVADEYTATLDRTLARVVSLNLRKQVTRLRVGCLLATTHADVRDELQPDIEVRCRLNGQFEVTVCDGDLKKKLPTCASRCGSPLAPSSTGRTSLGGITAVTTSG